jgi:H(+)-translocating pyrophosphatase
MAALGARSLLAIGIIGALSSPAFAQPQAMGALPWAYWLAPLGAVLALVFAFIFYKSVMRYTEGSEDMVHIAEAVRDGAYAYLRRQYKVVAIVFLLLIAVLVILGWGLALQPRLSALGVPIAGLLSGLCGFFGMKTATNASARTTAAAKESLNDGLRIAFRAGAVMGLCVTGFALLDVSLWFGILTQFFGGFFENSLAAITTVTLSFAMGASLQALFARVGGGIYTKAADVGADLVGKVEAGIPEDDARNPATIADNVGDNVGDVAGMGADLYESYYGSILASMALAAAASYRMGLEMSEAMSLIVAPPVLAGLGIIFAIIGIFTIRAKEGASFHQLMKSLHMGVWVASALIVVGSLVVLYGLLGGIETLARDGNGWLGIWGAILAGLAAGLVIAWGTEYYTSYENSPTKRVGRQAETGPATVIIAGVAEGMISTWIPLLTVVIAILLAFIFAGGGETFLLGVFGVGIAAVGMLSTLAITLATDAYGPIADNAGGNAEMTHQDSYVRERTDTLDSLGNTTAATGKGFAIGSAALTALALLAAYVTTVQTSINSQVVAAEPAQQITEDNPVSYYQYGLFHVRDPRAAEDDGVVAGLLLAPRNRDRVQSALRDGSGLIEVAWQPGEEVYQAAVELSGGEGTRTAQFQIAPAPTATLPDLTTYYNVTVTNPKVLAGLFVGVMLVFVFCAMTMNAVGRAAYAMMRECRRQFDKMKAGFKNKGMSQDEIDDPLQWPWSIEQEGVKYPDYANCVAISTAGAQKEMVVPSLMAVLVPIAVGVILGPGGVMGLLAGALVSGFAVAIFMANAGGAWDNAKKWIETGQVGGKGSEAHKAGVVGDTVGDPFKDTSGPSLNILIKLVSVVSVVFAGLIVKTSPIIAEVLNLPK